MKLPNSYYNSTSFFGSLIAGFSILVLAFLYILTHFMDAGGPYIGIVFYMVIPAFLILGLLMIPIGMVLKIRKEKKTGIEITQWKVINLNEPKTRNAMIVFFIGTFVLLFLSAIGSYQAFHMTESVEFCGELCHDVMKPEFVAYHQSAHARVKCVECHVGEGAGWYVRSKLSGLRQVFAVLSNSYPRPIPTPIENLRPARETCEKCHWPQKFYANRVINIKSYLADSANTAWNVSLKMKTGAKLDAHKLKEGIHWHINPAIMIEYITLSDSKESIPWVRMINTETGDTVIYQDEMNTLEEIAFDTLETRVMDCMDCHNRPSHQYKSPTDYIDDGFNKGTIPHDIPYFKQIALQALKTQFSTTDSTLNYVSDEITRVYSEDYPEVYNAKNALIGQAIDGLKAEFSLNCFPEMNVNHKAYTNHIGHQESPGCFRCHSGYHTSESGKTIRKDCNLCHGIVAQGPDVDSLVEYGNIDHELEFHHPENIDGAWKEMNCSDCHSDLY